MMTTGVILSILGIVFTGCLGKTIVTDDVVLVKDNYAALAGLLELLTSASGEDKAVPTADVGIHGDLADASVDVTDAVLQEIIAAITQDVDLDLEALLKGCSHGKCEFCTPNKWFKACVEASILKLGFEVTVSLNGRTIYHKEISIRNPPPFCVNKIPFLSHIADVCLQVYDIDLINKKACVKITFKVKLGPIKKEFRIKLGCFKIPHASLPEFVNDQASDDNSSALMFDGSPYAA